MNPYTIIPVRNLVHSVHDIPDRAKRGLAENGRQNSAQYSAYQTKQEERKLPDWLPANDI